jgi:hypothetical protein
MRHPFIRHARVAVLTLLAGALVGGCGQEERQGSLEPPSPPPGDSHAFTLEVTPASGVLSTTESGNTLYLAVAAWDQLGQELNTFGNGTPDGSYGYRHTLATFMTSDSAVATVSSRGTVLAVAPGSAVIGVTLTLSGVTRHASVNTVVRGPSTLTGAYPDLTGEYDLTATFHGGDLDWFPGSGTRWIARLTIQHPPAGPTFTGTFTDFRSTVPDGASYPGPSGSVRGQVDRDGRVAIQLSFGENTEADFSGQGVLGSDGVAGTFSDGYAPQGEFTMMRTEAEQVEGDHRPGTRPVSLTPSATEAGGPAS